MSTITVPVLLPLSAFQSYAFPLLTACLSGGGESLCKLYMCQEIKFVTFIKSLFFVIYYFFFGQHDDDARSNDGY